MNKNYLSDRGTQIKRTQMRKMCALKKKLEISHPEWFEMVARYKDRKGNSLDKVAFMTNKQASHFIKDLREIEKRREIEEPEEFEDNENMITLAETLLAFMDMYMTPEMIEGDKEDRIKLIRNIIFNLQVEIAHLSSTIHYDKIYEERFMRFVFTMFKLRD